MLFWYLYPHKANKTLTSLLSLENIYYLHLHQCAFLERKFPRRKFKYVSKDYDLVFVAQNESTWAYQAL